jgi:thioester reductase-like protein
MIRHTLLTGGAGLLGRHLLRDLSGRPAVALVRSPERLAETSTQAGERKGEAAAITPA